MENKEQVLGLPQACKNVHEVEPFCEDLTGCNSEESAHAIREEVSIFWRSVAGPSAIDEASRRMLEPMLGVYEVTAVQLSDLAIICSQRTDDEKQLLWSDSEKQLGTLVLGTLSANLTNMLVAIRLLILQGLDGQARLQLRAFVELSDLTAAVSFEHECFLHYLHSSNNRDNRKHWSRHLRPTQIRQVLKDLDKEIDMPEGTPEFVQSIRQDTYDWLSNYAHANFAAQLLSGTVPSKSGNGTFLPKLPLRVETDSKVTIFRATLYSWLTCMELLWLFIRNHDWLSLANNPETHWLHYRSKIIEQLMLINYPNMVSVEENV